MKMTITELKHTIAEILDEAKKSKDKAEKIKRMSKQVEAYGFYTEEHDFSAPLGAFNLYRQQGASNWGPYTSAGVRIDKQNAGSPNNGPAGIHEERALRMLVREVLQNGVIAEDSAWAPFVSKPEPIFESTWEEAVYRMNEAWYDDFRKGGKKEKSSGSGGSKGPTEKTKYGHVEKHGAAKSSKKSSKK